MRDEKLKEISEMRDRAEQKERERERDCKAPEEERKKNKCYRQIIKVRVFIGE